MNRFAKRTYAAPAAVWDAMVNMDERRKAIFVAFHDLIPGTTYVKPGEPWPAELRRAFDRTAPRT